MAGCIYHLALQHGVFQTGYTTSHPSSFVTRRLPGRLQFPARTYRARYHRVECRSISRLVHLEARKPFHFTKPEALLTRVTLQAGRTKLIEKLSGLEAGLPDQATTQSPSIYPRISAICVNISSSRDFPGVKPAGTTGPARAPSKLLQDLIYVAVRVLNPRRETLRSNRKLPRPSMVGHRGLWWPANERVKLIAVRVAFNEPQAPCDIAARHRASPDRVDAIGICEPLDSA